MAKKRYVRTEGKTVIDDLPPDERYEHAVVMQQVVFVQLIKQLGGAVIVDGLGDTDAIEDMMNYEIAMQGLGHGQIRLSLRRKAD